MRQCSSETKHRFEKKKKVSLYPFSSSHIERKISRPFIHSFICSFIHSFMYSPFLISISPKSPCVSFPDRSLRSLQNAGRKYIRVFVHVFGRKSSHRFACAYISYVRTYKSSSICMIEKKTGKREKNAWLCGCVVRGSWFVECTCSLLA